MHACLIAEFILFKSVGVDRRVEVLSTPFLNVTTAQIERYSKLHISFVGAVAEKLMSDALVYVEDIAQDDQKYGPNYETTDSGESLAAMVGEGTASQASKLVAGCGFKVGKIDGLGERFKDFLFGEGLHGDLDLGITMLRGSALRHGLLFAEHGGCGIVMLDWDDK